jgi:hypothetical protein
VPAAVATGPTGCAFRRNHGGASPIRRGALAGASFGHGQSGDGITTSRPGRRAGKARREGIKRRRTGVLSDRPGRHGRSAFIISHSFDRSRYLTAVFDSHRANRMGPTRYWRNAHGMGHKPAQLKTRFTRILNTSYSLILSKKIAVHTSCHIIIVIIVTSRCAKDPLGIVENCPTMPSRTSGTPALMRRLHADPATGE